LKKITYLISNETEADVRLSDAMLFAALRQALGDRIEPMESGRQRIPPGPVWGSDPYRSIAARTEILVEAYRDPAVLAALHAEILPRHAVQAEMARLTQTGFGAVLRNMRDPEQYVRHCARGDRFDQHETAIRSDRYDHPVLVHANLDLRFIRRFLIVAGEVAAETPYRHCEETPTDLLDPHAWAMQAEDFMSPLTQEDPVWRDLQRAEADRLLAEFPLGSGALDIGLRITADGEVSAHLEEVIAAPPGAFATFHADVRAYARAIAENLLRLEPELADPDAEEPRP
jgi:hypothetical protein